MVRLAFLLLPMAAWAADKPVIKYTPAATGDEAEERPVATRISVDPLGSDFAVRVVFDRTPWGPDCKSRCAAMTLFLDTDDNPSTGLNLGKDAAETGADLAVVIQGVREFKEQSAEPGLKVKVRLLPSGTTSIEGGDWLSEMDLHHDAERVQSDGTSVYALVDTTDPTIPSGKTIRVIYHPPGEKALTGKAKGMFLKSSGKIQVLGKKRGKEPSKRPAP